MKSKVLVYFSITFILIFVFPVTVLWFMTTQPFVAVKQQEIPTKASAERLSQHVVYLSTKLSPRDIDTDNLDKTVAYVKRHFAKAGKPYEMEYSVAGIPYRNLGIAFGPNGKKRIIVGAHYDSYEGLPGADDNASGVAGLMELALMLKDKPLRHQVELVAYTLEEPPYFATNDMGSYAHAKMLRQQGAEVIVMVSLEMIGYFSDHADSQAYPISLLRGVYPHQGNFIAVVGNLSGMSIVRRCKAAMLGATSLPVYSINTVPFMTGINFSDHMNFWIHDYPAIMITDTAFYRNTHYHTPQDTWEKLDYDKMAEVVNGVYGIVMEFAGTH